MITRTAFVQLALWYRTPLFFVSTVHLLLMWRTLALLVAVADSFPTRPFNADSSAYTCKEDCTFYVRNHGAVNLSSDGYCDDGGPGSEYHIISSMPSIGMWTCQLGHDCSDCGLREAPSPPPSGPPRASEIGSGLFD